MKNTILKDPGIHPELDKELVVICIDNSIFSPVRYGSETDCWVTIGGSIRNNLIKHWCYIDELVSLLDVSAADQQEYERQVNQAKREENQRLEQIKVKIISMFLGTDEVPEVQSKTVH